MNLKYFCIPLAGILLSSCEQTPQKTTKLPTPSEYKVDSGGIEEVRNERRGTSIPLDIRATPPDESAQLDSDRLITENIRKAISRTNFSTHATNIKIFSLGGVVTFKGSVETEKERIELGNIAKKIEGVNQVDNQLEFIQDK